MTTPRLPGWAPGACYTSVMVDAFLVGAGLSIGAAPLSMPSTDELGRTVVGLLKSIHRSTQSTHGDRCDGLSCDHPTLTSAGGWPAANFEAWLSSLAEVQPYRHEPDQLRAQALFVEIAGLVALEITNRTVDACEQVIPSPTWFADLVQVWHDRRCEVVSLNYDTLVEAVFESLEIRPVPIKPPTLAYRDIQSVSIPTWNDNMPARRRGSTMRLTKLHGSIHWYWDSTTRSAESMVDVGLPAPWRAQASNGQWRPNEWVPGREPMIVPPTASKTSFFTNPIVRKLWRHAFEAIRSADHLIVLGYSLPAHDTLVGSMLTEAIMQRGGLPVTVVNPDVEVLERARHLGLEPGAHYKTVEAFLAAYVG